jgi:hypothetical protein
VPRPITPKLLQSIARGHAQVRNCLGGIQDQELPERGAVERGRQPPDTPAREDLLGVLVPEALDHTQW